MNGNHVRPKLKIRNRILAIFVAFLLLSLMIPHAVFATESTDANSTDVAKEVNNEAADNAAAANEGEPAANAVTVSGKVTSDGSTGVAGVRVSAFQGNTEVDTGKATTDANGEYTLTLKDDVAQGETLMLMVNPASTYSFEVIGTTAGSTVNLTLRNGISTIVKPRTEDEGNHQKFDIISTVAGQQCSQTFYEKSFSYSFPTGGKFQMTSKAHMLFHYQNAIGQDVSVEFIAAGNNLYRPYFWGFITDSSPTGELMTIGQDYTLETGHTYTVALAYLNQTTLQVSSQDANHDAFNFVFKKNGVQMHELTQASFDTTMYVGATCTVQQDGTIKIYFDDSDVANKFVIEATITPIAKAGYKIASWTYNGETLKAGDSVVSTENVPMDFEAKYEVDASKAPATGDMNFVWIIALSGIALASAVGLRRFKRN